MSEAAERPAEGCGSGVFIAASVHTYRTCGSNPTDGRFGWMAGGTVNETALGRDLPSRALNGRVEVDRQ